MNLINKFNRSVRLILLWNILFCFGLSVYTVLYNLYLMEFINLKTIGTITGTSYISFAIFSVVGGILSDRFGPRKVLQIGLLILIIGFIGGLTTKSIFFLCAWAVLIGVGQAFTNTMFVPLLTEYSKEEERVKLFSVAFGTGNLFMFFGTLSSGVVAEKLSGLYSISTITSLQMVIFAAATIIFISGIPLLLVKNSAILKQKSTKGQSFSWKENKNVFSYTGVKLLEGIGTGFTIPFINLFLASRFNLNSLEISLFMSAAVFMTVIMIFVNPYITRKFGEMKILFSLQAILIPCLIILGFSTNIWICGVCFLCFRALLFARMPIQSKILMQKTPESIRGLTNSAGFMASTAGIGIAGPISMAIVSKLGSFFGYGWLFTVSSICFGLSVYLFYYVFERQHEATSVAIRKIAN
ncbi:MFS transporter [Bacillus sp. CGMCC 1.16607]|uniref:MFS transporter n=1 Tax=Bacillus sp. CGMCC 1.16607 TaxID=3351842 RepID=UPI0036453AD8